MASLNVIANASSIKDEQVKNDYLTKSKINNFTFNKVQILVIILLNILIPTMVEHISVALVVANIFLLIYSYLKQKKINCTQ